MNVLLVTPPVQNVRGQAQPAPVVLSANTYFQKFALAVTPVVPLVMAPLPLTVNPVGTDII